MKLITIGFMASGKSSVATLLAERFNFNLIDVDQLVIKTSKFHSIEEIFNTHGEEEFRRLETEAIRSLEHSSDIVISPGGGAIMRNTNVDLLRANNGKFIYLKTSFAEIKDRLAKLSSTGKIDRPLFRSESDALALYNLRLPRYEELADFTINTDGEKIGCLVGKNSNFIEMIQAFARSIDRYPGLLLLTGKAGQFSP